MGDEDTHLHAQKVQLGGDLLLERNLPPAHAVVLEGEESLAVHELELVDVVVAGMMPEHPEVGRVLELECT